jgi:hypothetical protein
VIDSNLCACSEIFSDYSFNRRPDATAKIGQPVSLPRSTAYGFHPALHGDPALMVDKERHALSHL